MVTRTGPRQSPVLATDSAVARNAAPVVALHDENPPIPDHKGNCTRWLSHVGSLADTTTVRLRVGPSERPAERAGQQNATMVTTVPGVPEDETKVV
jgi:hypothetical protein